MNGTTQSNDALYKELVDICRSESLSVDGLREIIERYVHNNNLNIDNYDFFIVACCNGSVTEEILRYLLEYFPDAASYTYQSSEYGVTTPNHCMCFNKNATLGMVQLLVDAFPESLRRAHNNGYMPLHHLCLKTDIEDTAAVDILGLLLERCPEAAQHAGTNGALPIHIAAGQGSKSLEFCRMLIEAYPGSGRMTFPGEGLPLHCACGRNTVAVAEYLYKLYPEGINMEVGNGLYPIQFAIFGLKLRANPANAIEMVQFLLDCNPNIALQKFRENLPLFWACRFYGASNAGSNAQVNAALEIAQALYDARPDAIIEDGDIAGGLRAFPDEIQTFINTQLNLARLARNSTVRQMKKRDENGQVPLHRAICDNATLGSIKLLVKRNPTAVQTPDNSGALPLHCAIQHNDSPKVVDYLVGLDPNTLTAVDREGNSALHLACRVAKYDTIALLLEKYGAVSVSQSNVLNKLPIHLLLESKAANRENDTKYLESVFQLLRANPETVMVSEDAKQASIPQVGRPSRRSGSGKKRKYRA